MFFKRKAHILFTGALLLCAYHIQARTSMYDASFNQNWKFYQGVPTGTPQATTYDDASWATVCVPHSASYDPPTVNGELAFYGNGTNPNKYYWYRKTFVCPANARKVFIQFGAIMETATIFVNGQQVGQHLNTGYTGFFFDISNNLTRGQSNSIAVQAYISNSSDIPPATNPDYLLYSGMYRNVTLLFKDSVYVPLRGQKTAITGSAASPTVHAVTSVRNDAPAAKSVTVTTTLLDASGTSVATQTATQSINGNSTSAFDMTTPVVSSPHLWSPSTPYLYSLHTVLKVNGSVIDSVVEPVGLRFFSWSAATPGGLSINGVRTEVKGVCVSQWIAWMENAVPDSRWAKIVGMVKDMGLNGIRTAHYPRADAFYRACDSIGVLLLVECPNWGTQGGFNGKTVFWNHLYTADSEMVLDAYNHPSIWGWSLFNEPTETTLMPYFSQEDTIVKSIERPCPTDRVTLVSQFGGDPQIIYPMDIHGINYRLAIPTTSPRTDLPMINTENYHNFNRNFVRGNAMDLDVSNSSEAYAELYAGNFDGMIPSWATTDKCAGAHFWCFMDYCSRNQTVGREGLVDRLYLPKNVYFMFRNALTGAATDYWSNGTPTHVVLAADLTNLKANGTDISQIVATFRDANGACKHEACNVTFTVSSGTSSVAMLYTGESVNPTSGASAVTCAVEGGRAGIYLRTSTTPGAITVTATTSCGLAATTVGLTSTAADETLPTLSWGGTAVSPEFERRINDVARLKTAYTGKGIMISFPSKTEKTVHILNSQGKTVASYTLKNGIPALVSHSATGSGIFNAVWDDNGRRMLARLNMVR
jgi:beta-galactosidase